MIHFRSSVVVCLLTAAAACVVAAEPKPVKPMDVEITGRLETGIVAIGGETTGIVVRTKEGSWELDLGDDADLKRRCEQLNQKQVRVTGKSRIVAGVEVPERRIVRVAKISAVD